MGQIAAGNTSVVFDGANYSTSTSSFPFAGLLSTTGSTGGPKAYLNWLIFDRNYTFITGGYQRMSAAPMEQGQDVAHELMSSPNITITQAGYVYIYLSNEETGPVEVFFDDFKVTHTKSPVVQMDDYYPFGLAHSSYTRENSVAQDFKYNGKELQDELGLGWLDYGARMYQPDLGRFFVQDRFAEKYMVFSPYQYAANNPIKYIDVNGDSLQLNGSESARQNFTDLVNKGLGGKGKISIDKSGNASLEKGKGKMTKQQKSFFKDLQSVIENSGKTTIGLVENDKGVEVGSFDQETIDVADARSLGSSDLTSSEAVSAQGALIHEVTEQFEKQVNGVTNINLAHATATASENRTNGSTRVGSPATVVQDKRGTNVGSSLNSTVTIGGKSNSVNIIIINGNVNRVLVNGVVKK